MSLVYYQRCNMLLIATQSISEWEADATYRVGSL